MKSISSSPFHPLSANLAYAVRVTEGIDHVISVTSDGKHVHIRHYRIVLKKSGSKLPLVEVRRIVFTHVSKDQEVHCAAPILLATVANNKFASIS